MSDDTPQSPSRSPQKAGPQPTREEALARALRANLRRRKAGGGRPQGSPEDRRGD